MQFPIKSLVVASAMVAAVVPSSAMAQSKFLQTLEKINQGLSVLSGEPVAGASGRASGVAALNVRKIDTGITAQQNRKDNTIWDGPVEVLFQEGRTDARVAQFNDSLPVIKEVLGIMSCAVDGNYHQVSTVLKRYEVEGGAHRVNGYMFYGLPMERMGYHDKSECLAVKKVVATVPAPNMIKIVTTYLATDSLEEIRQTTEYRKNYKNTWQLFSHSNCYE